MLKEAVAMRMFLIAVLTAVGIGLAGTSAAPAAPINGAIISDLATATNPVTTVYYYYYHWHTWRRWHYWRRW